MNKISNIVKQYNTKKLIQIIELQSSSYSESFIDCAKDELIMRGESFQFNPEYIKEMVTINDIDLKDIVENKWMEYHLEYVEVARMEYIKRDFHNPLEDEQVNKKNEILNEQYPALTTISGLLKFVGWLTGIASIIIAFVLYSKMGEYALLFAIPIAIIGTIITISLIAMAESIAVIVDSEENTRLIYKKLDADF